MEKIKSPLPNEAVDTTVEDLASNFLEVYNNLNIKNNKEYVRLSFDKNIDLLPKKTTIEVFLLNLASNGIRLEKYCVEFVHLCSH